MPGRGVVAVVGALLCCLIIFAEGRGRSRPRLSFLCFCFRRRRLDGRIPIFKRPFSLFSSSLSTLATNSPVLTQRSSFIILGAEPGLLDTAP